MDTTLSHEAVARFERIEKFLSEIIHRGSQEEGGTLGVDAARQEGESPLDHLDRIVNPKPVPEVDPSAPVDPRDAEIEALKAQLAAQQTEPEPEV